jgi:arginyl-tRNA synthetase
MISSLTTTGSLNAVAAVGVLRAIVEAGLAYGRSDKGRGQRVLLEFVSANPNGPVTAERGRGGVLGDTLAALLDFTGYAPTREFYVNDATNSRQMRQFARVVWANYRRLLGEEAGSADGALANDGGYPDEFVERVARELVGSEGDRLNAPSVDESLARVQEAAARLMRREQEETLASLGVRFDSWFSESNLHAHGAVGRVLARLRDAGHAYEQGSALWLRSTHFGDEADRTLVRADGTPTYLAGDLAYHAHKFERGYDILIDIWSDDHAGYVERTRAGLAALGYDPARLHILLHGPVRLLKDGTEVKGRFGGVLTLAELVAEIPRDTARLLLLRGPVDAPLDLDADAASRRDRTNPVAYLGEALRLCDANLPVGDADFTGSYSMLAEHLGTFPEAVHGAAATRAPGRLLAYALSLADRWIPLARAGGVPALLAQATAVVLTSTLGILGVAAVEEGAVNE